MRACLFLLLLLPLLGFLPADSNFRAAQARYPRVRGAYARFWPSLQTELRLRHLAPEHFELYLRAFKSTRRLEVWARNSGRGTFQRLRNYPIAAASGTLGPKRRAGDAQVPEGCYFIDRFNPNSNYHLSLGLNYPNAADRAWGEPDPGSDIFIHGSNVTVGCLPITDVLIEELYVLAVEARAGGQREVPVHIFPFELTEAALATRQSHYYHSFWLGLAPAYRYFEQHRTLPEVSIAATGAYVVK